VLGICQCSVAAAARSPAAHRQRMHVWSSLNAVGFYRAIGYRERRRARWPIQPGIELDHVLLTRRLVDRSAPGQGTAGSAIATG
jgi:hypothetical protein